MIDGSSSDVHLWHHQQSIVVEMRKSDVLCLTASMWGSGSPCKVQAYSVSWPVPRTQPLHKQIEDSLVAWIRTWKAERHHKCLTSVSSLLHEKGKVTPSDMSVSPLYKEGI